MYRLSLFTEDVFCRPLSTCVHTPGYFGSESFLEEYSTYSVTKWVISPGEKTSYIELVFNEFDIGCDSGSYFQIKYLSENVDGYCNLNKPFGQVRSKGSRLEVTFHPNVQPDSMPEGFSATFNKVMFQEPDWTDFQNSKVNVLEYLGKFRNKEYHEFSSLTLCVQII